MSSVPGVPVGAPAAPIPNPQTWHDAATDLKADGLALLQPLINFEVALASKDAGIIAGAAAVMPQEIVAALPGIGAQALGQLLSVGIAKAVQVLTPKASSS